MGWRDRSRFGAVTASMLFAAVCAIGSPARAENAERVTELAARLSAPSSSVKERIGAVTAMARLADQRSLRPLTEALGDPSSTVRAIAVAGLGKLAAVEALPVLRELEARDPDPLVRRQAQAAMHAITGIGATSTPAPAMKSAGFGSQPREVRPRPDLYVVVKSGAEEGAKRR